MNNFKMVFLFAVGICDTNRMMSMLKEVSVVENRQWPAVKHNLLIVLHALANESLCLNALGHIQYPQKLPPDIWLARHNWRKLKTNDINRHQVFGFFSFGFLFSQKTILLSSNSGLVCVCTWSVSDWVFCNSKCNTLIPSSWNTCSARARPPTWLFRVNIMDVLSGDILSCRFNLSFDADDVYARFDEIDT